MILMKAFKYRLKTNSTTSAKLASIAGSNRFVWNWSLANQKARLENKEYTETYAAMCNSLLKIKNMAKYTRPKTVLNKSKID